MHLKSLQYFRDVVQEKSISKVAKKSHISQSALSQIIQKLEEDFGYKLLKRSNKGVESTIMGDIVMKYAINIIRNYERMVSELEAKEKNNNKVRISGTWSLVSYSLPCVIYKMKKRFPGYNYELLASTLNDTIRDVQNDICDFGIIDGVPRIDLDLFKYKLGKERVVLIAPAKYNISDQIDLLQFTKFEIIMCDVNARICKKLENQLKLIDKSLDDLKIIFNVDTIGAVKSAVTNGYGMAFVPYESIKHELYEKTVKVIEIDDIKLDYDIYLISKKLNSLPKATKESIEYFIEIGSKSFC